MQVAYFVNKSNWPRGEWDNEPDFAIWRDENTGLDCVAVRVPMVGMWCGYVGIPATHPSAGINFMALDLPRGVHGGVTFSASEPSGVAVLGAKAAKRVGDLPSRASWWFGFDCAHARDLSPGMIAMSGMADIFRDSTYRNFAYVRAECASLASQLSPRLLTNGPDGQQRGQQRNRKGQS